MSKRGNRPTRRWSTSGRDDQGASLIEFALVTPLLLLLVLGIIEFGWLLGQYNDVRHGAREGARFAAVDAGTSTEIKDHVCAAMEGLTTGLTSIEVNLLSDGGSRGSAGSIEVVAAVDSLSEAPMISTFLPSELRSEVEFRLEQNSSKWSTGTAGTC